MYLNRKACEDYYCAQVGGDIATFYRGGQRGKGWFTNLFRTVTPLLKKAGSYLGKRALSAGSKVAADLASGDNFKDVMKRRLMETGGEIKDDIIKKIQGGSGIKRRRKPKKRILKKDIFENGLKKY